MAIQMATQRGGMAGNRRDYGTGSITQRKDGRWIGAFDAGWTAKGTRRRITVSAKTKPECKRKLDARKQQFDRDGTSDVSTKATVKSWADQWIEHQERHLRPSSFSTTRSAVAKWIIPTIGHRRFDLLTPADVRAVDDAQRAAGLSTSTQRRTRSVLSSLLKDAMAEGYPVPPRVLVLKKPVRAVSDRNALSVQDALAVLAQASQLPHGSRWVAALLQGMRQGEALGLTWPEVDLARERLTISWQLQSLRYRVPYDRTSGFRVPDGYEARRLHDSLHLVRPKSQAGWRVIPLVPWMTAALTAWEAAAPPCEHGLVWPNLNGTPTYYKVDDAEWYGLQGAAEIGHPAGRYYTVHEARHTTATLLHEAGVDPTVIIAILGHSSIVTSRGYMHASVDRARDALEDVAKTLQLT